MMLSSAMPTDEGGACGACTHAVDQPGKTVASKSARLTEQSRFYKRTISRFKLRVLLRETPRCIVAMEACTTSHFGGRFASAAGQKVRLIPPIYVEPCVTRQKKDAADAAVIVSGAVAPPCMVEAQRRVSAP